MALPPVPRNTGVTDENGNVTPVWSAWFEKARSAIGTGGGGGGAVTSVNTLTGAVVLTTTQISEGTSLYWTTSRGDARYYTKAQVDTSLAAKENGLGNPSHDGYVLSSTAAGVRSWVAVSSNIDGGSPSSIFGGTTGFDGGTP